VSQLPRIAIVLAAAAVAALAARGVAVGSPDGATVKRACTERTFPGLPVKHTRNLDLKPRYNSFPPTSGTHYYLPAKFNLYTFALPQLVVVHNLEHGGIAVQYGARVSKATVAKIKAWYLGDTNGLIVAPLPELGDKIALTAWNAPPYTSPTPDPGHGYVATCGGFDAAAFTAFVKAHRYRGGERFAKSTLMREK
jgi:hypothetical protein